METHANKNELRRALQHWLDMAVIKIEENWNEIIARIGVSMV